MRKEKTKRNENKLKRYPISKEKGRKDKNNHIKSMISRGGCK